MKKVKPNSFLHYTGDDYEEEIKRIYDEIRLMDDIDFEIIINTDIPFYLDFIDGYNRAKNSIRGKNDYFFNPSFQELKKMPISSQKARYSLYLRNVFMFTSYFSNN